VISQSPEVTALQRLGYEISHNILCGTPLDAYFLHVHPIRNEEVSNVDLKPYHSVPTELNFCYPATTSFPQSCTPVPTGNGKSKS